MHKRAMHDIQDINEIETERNDSKRGSGNNKKKPNKKEEEEKQNGDIEETTKIGRERERENNKKRNNLCVYVKRNLHNKQNRIVTDDLIWSENDSKYDRFT